MRQTPKLYICPMAKAGKGKVPFPPCKPLYKRTTFTSIGIYIWAKARVQNGRLLIGFSSPLVAVLQVRTCRLTWGGETQLNLRFRQRTKNHQFRLMGLFVYPVQKQNTSIVRKVGMVSIIYYFDCLRGKYLIDICFCLQEYLLATFLNLFLLHETHYLSWTNVCSSR